MHTTIDRAGRLVIPKPIRDRLGLASGGEVEVTERDGVIEIAPAPTAVTVVETSEGPVAVPTEVLPALTDALTRDTVDRLRP